MRICFIAETLNPGGAERTITYLSNFFADKKIDVDIVLYGERGIYDFNKNVNIVFKSKLNWKQEKKIYKKIIKLILGIRAMRAYYNKNKPDAIICMLYGSFIYTVALPRCAKIISSERSNPEQLKSVSKKILRKYILKKSDGFIFQTKQAKDFLRGNCNSIVIQNAVGNEYSYTVNSLNISKEKKISAIGSLKDEKDYFTLIKASKIVFDKYPDYYLEIYGDGYLKKKLVKFSEHNNLKDKIIFYSARADALVKIKNATCYVLSSISEGMPNSLMEAMAIGLPCISTNCHNGPDELIKDEQNGLLVEVNNPSALAAAIIRFIDDPIFALECGKNARKILHTNNVNIIAEQYLNYIIKIAGTH